MNEFKTLERYQRQMLLKELGQAGQQKLSAAKVLVIGAGGLGCSALQWLAAAGVGTICIVDDDVVAVHNLHRQILFRMEDIGYSKAERAAAALQKLNPEISIISNPARCTVSNALELMSDCHIILDGTDNFSSRYLINDACVLLKKPMVYGAVSRFEGQVAVFNLEGERGEAALNYRDLFPIPPNANEVFNCDENGVLGVLPGIIGTLQATETIKIITGIGKPLVNQLLTWNALNNETYIIDLFATKGTGEKIPKSEGAFRKMDYEEFCSPGKQDLEIDALTFDQLVESGKINFEIIDVREKGELPLVAEFPHSNMNLQQIIENDTSLGGETIVLFCQSGSRSLQAAHWLSQKYGPERKFFSLKGGITEWKELKNLQKA